jgi:uncharacterized integral membrane protein
MKGRTSMGEKQVIQPLTREDKVTVVLYRSGIVFSTILISGLAYLLAAASSDPGASRLPLGMLGYGLYASVGLSVFFIHLYIGKFKTFLKNLYFLSLGCLVALIFLGKGSLADGVAHAPVGPLLLLPLSGCLGFVTAKEAFCFQLFEGYILAMVMPIYLLLVAVSSMSYTAAVYGLVLIAAMLVIFIIRKASMPLAYDIGDKSAYQ